MGIATLRRRIRGRIKPTVAAPEPKHASALVDIDLTRPDWDTVRDLAEDFDSKMDSFMDFDDGQGGAEREWLIG